MPGDIPIFASRDYRPETPPVSPPEQPAASAAVTPPSAEQARAVEAAFAQRDENASVAALLGIWTSAMLLNDLVQEAYEQTAERPDPPKRKPENDS
jgi:hypothetical protein